MIAVHLIF